MASLRTLAARYSFLISRNAENKIKADFCERYYSVFPKSYVKPVYDKKEQKSLEEVGELKVLSHLSIKPAFVPHTSSEFYDSIVNKFINYLNREGNKERARKLLQRTFELVKRIQLERYHKTTPEEQKEIELDPKVILHKAVENATPVLELLKIKRGGITYQVPVPLTEKRASFLAMNWLIRAGLEKEFKRQHLPERLAYELIDAYGNKGRVIKKKQELYRQCEANRSFAHFRWT